MVKAKDPPKALPEPAPEPKETITVANDGLHPGMDFSTYCQLKRVNQSMLSRFALSASHARHYLLDPPEPSRDQMVGTCGHYCILEPDLFDALVVAAPKFDKRRTEGKQAWKKFLEDHEGKEVLTQDEFDLCKLMRKAVLRHPMAKQLIEAQGANEVTACWTDPDSKFECKGRIDRMCLLYGYTVILDVKTCRSSDTEKFMKSMADYLYHLQSAFYLDGLNILSPGDRRYWIMAIEKSPPYEVQVFEVDTATLEQGRLEYRTYLERYRHCLDTGIWPGYSTGVVSIGLPRWYKGLKYVEELMLPEPQKEGA